MTNSYSWENFLEMDILDLYYYMKLLYVRPFISHGGTTFVHRQKLIGPPQEKQIIMQKFHIVIIDLNKSIVDAVSL